MSIIRLIFALLVIALAANTALAQSPSTVQQNAFSYTTTGTTFANLNLQCGSGTHAPIPPNCANQTLGTVVYCQDCAAGVNGACAGGGTGLFAKRVGPSGWKCADVNITTGADITNYHGAVGITGNGGNGSDQVSQVNVNGVLNVNTFSGADLGAKVNNTIAALPNNGVNGTKKGTIQIPITGSPYTLSTTALVPPDVSIECDRGAVINQTATIGFDQNVYDSTGAVNNEFSAFGGINNCMINGANAPNGAIGIQFGDTNGLHYNGDSIFNFNQPNDKAMLGINKNYFTEHTRIEDLMLEQDSGGLEFLKQCLTGTPGAQCQNSFDYNWVKMRCGTYYGPANGGANAFCMAAEGGALAIGSTFNIRANIFGQTGFHQEVVYVDGTSTFSFNTLDVHYEDNGAAPGQDYWVYIVSGGNVQANSGTLLGGTGTNSFPTGNRIQNWGQMGLPVNLVPDPGFRFGNLYWSLNTGWSILTGWNDTGNGVMVQGGGLNVLAVQGNGSPTGAPAIATSSFAAPQGSSICMSVWVDTTPCTGAQPVVEVESGASTPVVYSYANVPLGQRTTVMNNCAMTDGSGTAKMILIPNGTTIANGAFLMFAAPMISAGTAIQSFTDSLYGTNSAIVAPVTVAALPTLGNINGQSRKVSDWNGTVSACVGGGAHYGEAIWNAGAGTWACH
jgi:hypothetical protein